MVRTKAKAKTEVKTQKIQTEIEVKKDVEVQTKVEVKEEVKEEVQKNVPVKIRWKNNGGTFRLNKNQIIKPGQVFKAFPEEIPKAFRDVITSMDSFVEVTEKEKVENPANIVKQTYSLKESEEEGLFDIYNAKGKKMNEVPLEEQVAQQLINDLSN
jgi:hypothetical protein